MTSTLHDDLREDEILTGWALRFDGSKYAEETGWSHEVALAKTLESRQLPVHPEERLCLFYMLQRFLMKWGGEDLSRDGIEWWAFRELFLQSASMEIESEWQQDEPYAEWESRDRSRRDEHIEFVRRVHSETEYESE